MRAASRVVSLDAFRGATVAAMVLVNNPGTWSAIYWPLDHAAWNGWTPTDLIFPFFLFIVGVAMGYSRKGSFGHALRRSSILFGLGLFMAAFPYFDLTTVRIPGVLARIAVCYLAAWLLRRGLGPGGQAAACALLLVGYWLLMTRLDVPGGYPPNLEPETNLGAWLDRTMLGGHLWRQTKTWDPEGMLSTLPAIGTTLLGSLAGEVYRSDLAPKQRVLWLVGAGAALMLAGLAWNESFPINKNLWTSSYVLFTGGMAAALLGLSHLVADIHGIRWWTGPCLVYGRNAIAVFVASGLVAKLLGIVKLDGVPLQVLLYRGVFAPWAAPKNASLAFALANVLGWYLVLLWLDRRGLHLSV
jgi:predicted acyltransferase